MNTQFPTIATIVPVALLLCAVQQVAPASAQGWGFTQQQQQMSPQQMKAAIEEKKKKSKRKFSSNRLDKLQDIPFVPKYPASPKSMKIVRAIKYSSLGKGDNCLVQTFLLKDPPDNVRSWYKQSLEGYGWKVQSANKTETQLQGRRIKDGATIHVMVSACSPSSKSDGFRSMVQLRYVQWVPLPDSN